MDPGLTPSLRCPLNQSSSSRFERCLPLIPGNNKLLVRLKFLPCQLPLFFSPFAPVVSRWVEGPAIGRASTQDVPHHCLSITGPTASAPASKFFGSAAHVSWSLSLTPPPRCLHPVPPNPPVLSCMIFLVSIIDSTQPPPPSF